MCTFSTMYYKKQIWPFSFFKYRCADQNGSHEVYVCTFKLKLINKILLKCVSSVALATFQIFHSCT